MTAAYQRWHDSPWFATWLRLARHAALMLACVCSMSGATVLNMTFDADTPPTVVDNSGSGNNGTLNGATSNSTNCFSGSCYNFDGTTQRIDVPNSASLNATTGITISAWVQAVGLDNYPPSAYLAVIDKSPAYYFSVRSDGVVLFYLWGVNNWITSLQNDHAIFDGAWHHLIATYDGSAQSIYIDGKLNSTTAASGTINISAVPLAIGSSFKGTMDEVRIQDAGVSASGALALWKSYGTPRTTPRSCYISSSGSDSNDGLSSGAPWKSLSKIYSEQFKPYQFIPGDSILLKRGDTFEGQISTLYLDGSAGSPITFGAYGAGANPKVYGDGRNLIWAAVGGYTGVYESMTGAGSKFGWVFQGTNHFGTAPNYYAEANWKTLANATWAHPYGMTDRVWIRTTNDAAPAGMTLFRNALNLLRSSYITVKDIDFESLSQGRVQNSASVTVTNATVKWSINSGLFFTQTTNCIADAVTVTTAGDTSIYLVNSTSNIVRNCVLNGISTNINGFPNGGVDLCGVGLLEGNSSLVEHCQFYNPFGTMNAALDVYYENDSIVRWNYADGVSGWFPNGNNNWVYGNLLNGKGVAGCGATGGCPSDHLLHNSFGKTGVATNNYTLNNTFWNFRDSQILYPGGVFKNNILYGTDGLVNHRRSVSEFGACDYNVYYLLPPYTSTPRFVIWEPSYPGGTETLYQSWAAYQAAAPGVDTHSVYADPLFVSTNMVINLRIQATSPARGAGVFIAAGNDFAGNAMSNPPSIGAYEYRPETVLQSPTVRAGKVRRK